MAALAPAPSLTIVNGSEEFLSEDFCRQLSKKVSKALEDAIKRGESLLAKSPKQVYDRLKKGDCVVILAGGELVAYYALGLLAVDGYGNEWYERESLLVLPEYRHIGYGTLLFEVMRHRKPNAILVGTTKNQKALHLCMKCKYELVSYDDIPEEIKLGLCKEASCYKPCYPDGPCVNEHNLGGGCFVTIRMPLSS